MKNDCCRVGSIKKDYRGVRFKKISVYRMVESIGFTNHKLVVVYVENKVNGIPPKTESSGLTTKESDGYVTIIKIGWSCEGELTTVVIFPK